MIARNRRTRRQQQAAALEPLHRGIAERVVPPCEKLFERPEGPALVGQLPRMKGAGRAFAGVLRADEVRRTNVHITLRDLRDHAMRASGDPGIARLMRHEPRGGEVTAIAAKLNREQQEFPVLQFDDIPLALAAGFWSAYGDSVDGFRACRWR